MMQEKKLPDGNFSVRLVARMESLSMKGKDLARLADVTPAAISRYLAGRIPNSEELFRLSGALGVSMEWLLAGTDASNKSPIASGVDRRQKTEIYSLLEQVRQLVRDL